MNNKNFDFNDRSTRSAYIDLNDYITHLQPYQNAGVYARTAKNFFECPSCGGKLSINRSNGEKFTCYNCGDRAAIRKAVLALAGDDNNTRDEYWEQKRHSIAAQRAEADRIRTARLKTSEQRHQNWTSIVERSSLTDKHQQDMLDRGYTRELIEKCNARSIGGGRVIPILDYLGQMVGGQVIKGKGEGKPWYGAGGTNQLKETGEIPLTVIYPDRPTEIVVTDKLTGNHKLQGSIAYVESTGDKPWLCAHNQNMVTIGSAIVGSQPKDLERTVEGIKADFGWDDVIHVLMADAGSVLNKQVMTCYRNLNRQLHGQLLVGYWGQIHKGDGDIDEIDLTTTKIEYISFAQFEEISKQQNGLLHRFFSQFRPKKERVKPVPASKVDDGAIEYKDAPELNSLLQTALARGIKVVLDVTHAGGFKSTTAAQIDGLTDIDRYFYINSNHRNPTTAEVETNFADFPSRHNGLVINPDRVTPNGNPYLQTKQPTGMAWQEVPGNCHQADLHHVLADKGHDLNGSENPICRVCPQLNACNHAVGNGYGYKHAKHEALKQPRLRMHPQSLPHPGDAEDKSAVDYTRTMLTWDDEKIKIQRSVEATEKDFHDTIAYLAINHPELLPAVNSIIAKLRKLYAGELKEYYGLSHERVLADMGEVDPIVMAKIITALTPDFSELVQECDGIDTAGMTATERRTVKAADRIMAADSKRDNQSRLKNFPSNWLIALLEVMVTGEGYVRWDGRKLVVTQPDRYHQQIVREAGLSLFLDATGNREELAKSLGISPDQVMVIRKPQPEYPNLKIVQVMGLGTPKKVRSDLLVQRIEAFTTTLTKRHKNLGIIDWNREGGKGLWFADSRGTNRYKDCDALALIGSPCPNLGAIAAEFAILYGRQVNPTSEDLEYRAFLSRRIESEIVQAIARLRSHLAPEEPKTIYLVAEREDLPLDQILGYYPACQFERIEAIDTDAEAGTPLQQVRYKVMQFLRQNGTATQAEIAQGIGYSQGYISKLFKALGGGFKKILLVLLKELYRDSNKNHTPSSLTNWEELIDPDLVAHTQVVVLDSESLSVAEKQNEVLNIASSLNSQQLGALFEGLGTEYVRKFFNYLVDGFQISLSNFGGCSNPNSIVPIGSL